jgi:hypothetical protein
VPIPLPAIAGGSALILGRGLVFVCMTSSSSSAVRSIVLLPFGGRLGTTVGPRMRIAGVGRRERLRESGRELTISTSSNSIGDIGRRG